MIPNIKTYLYVGSLVILFVITLIVSIALHISNKKIESLKETHNNLKQELDITKKQVNEMEIRIKTFKVSEKIVQDYSERKDEIEDNKNTLKDNVYESVINNEEACNWWDTKVPDSIITALSESFGLRRNEICD